MILQYLSALWAAVAPALADHLWQSTLFALVAGVLTLALRRNSAHLRYSLWLAASLKFLVPFSLLVAIGGHLSWRHSSAASAGGLYVVEEVGRPFTSALPLAHPPVPALATTGTGLPWLPILFGVWLCGFLIVLFIWIARWSRISATIRSAVVLKEGREVSTLRRLERLAEMPMPMNILLSRGPLEPGVFGIRRPVLLWPHSISEHLDDAHLEAALAHELSHVRRRDNLVAAVHMLVEAIFWFHPLVWWLGSRLIDERERACDEAVLELGSHRHVYAESILKICEFCLSSPLTCVSGVTGADLKKRMVHIMTDHIAHKLDFTRKLLLGTAAFLAIALPIAFGLFSTTPSRAQSAFGATPKFASVSIKPHISDGTDRMLSKFMMSPADGSFRAVNVSPHDLIQLAYRIQDSQLIGEPEWFKSARYDITATADKATAEEIRAHSTEPRNPIGQQLLQHLLTDNFNVTLHQASLDLPVYELVVAEGGSKLQKAGEHGFMHMGMGELSSKGTPLELLAAQLSQRLGRPVVDKTGLQGDYAYSLRWTPDADEASRIRAAGGPPDLAKVENTTPTADAPPLMTAVEEQLGLKLESQTTRVPVLVIDHAEPPAAN
jgi:bla regulator protein blaR1